MSFGGYLKDKTVILIGPAGYYNGEDDGGHDIVVRMNRCISSSPANIYYLSAQASRGVVSGSYPVKFKPDWIVSKKYATEFFGTTEFKVAKFKPNFRRRLRDGVGIEPLMATWAICHLLQYKLKKLTIRGVDFYMSGYRPEVDKRTLDTVKEQIATQTAHIPCRDIDYIRGVLLDDRVDIDQTLKDILYP